MASGRRRGGRGERVADLKEKKKKIMYKLGCKIIIRKLKERQNYVFIDYEDIM